MAKLIRKIFTYLGIVKYNIYLIMPGVNSLEDNKLVLVESSCRNPEKYATVDWSKRYIWGMKSNHSLFISKGKNLYVIKRLR